MGKLSYANLQTILLMNKKHTLAMLAMVFGVALSPIISADDADARRFDNNFILYGDLTAPNGDKPFGGQIVGAYNIHVKDELTSIYAGVEKRASNGMIFEGWLVDVETGEKLSTGTFKEGVKRGFFFLNEPEFHYDVFVITEEPIIDSDPAPTLPPVGGVPLSTPFGQ